MHAHVMHIGSMYTCTNDCIWHMYMPMCYIHAYISISISELYYPPPHSKAGVVKLAHEDYIHTYVTYILLYMWPICI